MDSQPPDRSQSAAGFTGTRASDGPVSSVHRDMAHRSGCRDMDKLGGVADAAVDAAGAWRPDSTAAVGGGAIAILSRGLNQIIEGVVGQMRSLDLFATAYQDQHAALLAQPLR